MAVTVLDVAQLIGARMQGGTAEQAQVPITEVGLNSAELPAGALFAAVPGTRVHGARFAADTAAAAILTDEAGWGLLSAAGETRPVLVVDDVRSVLGVAAAAVYGDPSSQLTVIGITGTSGKTTTSYMLEAGLLAAGYRVGLIGTTGTQINGRPVPTSLTTPEAPTLQALFVQMLAEGVTHVVMEVSSHALMLGRVLGVKFDVAGFTNLSQDHLDFHATMAEYFDAKALFFRPGSPTRAARAVVCVDDEWGEKMASVFGSGVRTLATRGQAGDYTVSAVQTVERGGQEFRLAAPSGAVVAATVPLPGRFNVANAALALALADTVGVDMTALLPGLAGVGVPGRMEVVDCGQDFLAVVDYAHKPAAIKAVLATVRGQITGRIGLVVGAGGDRDLSTDGAASGPCGAVAAGAALAVWRGADGGGRDDELSAAGRPATAGNPRLPGNRALAETDCRRPGLAACRGRRGAAGSMNQTFRYFPLMATPAISAATSTNAAPRLVWWAMKPIPAGPARTPA